MLPPFTTGKTLDEEQQHLREKARLLLQREREHTALLQKYERLAVWLGLGQALPALFLDRKSTPQQRWDRVRKILISRLRVQIGEQIGRAHV